MTDVREEETLFEKKKVQVSAGTPANCRDYLEMKAFFYLPKASLPDVIETHWVNMK